ILTGAMIPYAFGSSSDGFFNLGCALSFVQCKPQGVYVSMNGQCFDFDNVVKNKDQGFFQTLH
ncbi:MAG: asparaginase, partial [Flavobacteriia bacterium]|nr:asparaginase [Flavobacteriia bacterium]